MFGLYRLITDILDDVRGAGCMFRCYSLYAIKGGVYLYLTFGFLYYIYLTFFKFDMETRLKKSLENCGICLGVITVRGKLNSCKHMFCLDCIKNWSEVSSY